MRAHNRLSAAKVKAAPPGEYCDGRGLWLRKRPGGGGQWVLRVTIHGRRREMGLGGLSDVSLAAAREAAERWRAVAASGRDPVKEREREARESSRADTTLRVLAVEAFEARIADWPEVMECYLMTGDADYLLRVVAADLTAYQDFLMHKLTRVAGVASIKSSFALRRIQYRTALPLAAE